MQKHCYGSGMTREECASCDLVKYCKEATDPRPFSTVHAEYDDTRGDNGNTTPHSTETTEKEPAKVITSHDLTQALIAIVDILQTNKTRHKVLLSWLLDFDGSPARGRDGLVNQIAKKCDINPRTARRHIQALSSNPLLSTVFKYENCRIGLDRKYDRGTEPKRETRIKQGRLL